MMNSQDFYNDKEMRKLWYVQHNIKLDILFRNYWGEEVLEKNTPLDLVWQKNNRQPDKASYILWLYWNEYYNINTCALIAETSYDYVRQVLVGKRALDACPDDAEARLYATNKRMVDKIMSLRHLDDIPADSRFNYISFLSYLGFKYEHIQSLFGGNKSFFLWLSSYRSKQAWKELKGSLFGFDNESFARLIGIKTPLIELREIKAEILKKKSKI